SGSYRHYWWPDYQHPAGIFRSSRPVLDARHRGRPARRSIGQTTSGTHGSVVLPLRERTLFAQRTADAFFVMAFFSCFVIAANLRNSVLSRSERTTLTSFSTKEIQMKLNVAAAFAV